MASVKSVISGYSPHNWQRSVKSNDKIFSRWNNEDVKAISNNRYIRDVLGSTSKSQKHTTRRVQLPALNNVVERNIQSNLTQVHDKKRAGESCSLMCCYHSWIKRDEIPLSVVLERKLKEVALLQYGKVRKLLQRYQMFRGAMSSIYSKYDEDKAAAQDRLNVAKQKANKELSDLEMRLGDLEAVLGKKNVQLRTLLTYKDKDYPVKAMKILELKHQIDSLRQEQESELGNLNGLIGIEGTKLHLDEGKATETLLGDITDRIIDSMPKGVKELALQNIAVKQEIRLQKEEENELSNQIDKLRREIEELSSDPQTNVPLHVFKPFFVNTNKCEENTNFQMNILKKDPLLLQYI
ncbi:uncharacterized protein TRIADDRAFT_60143 [Trichoplax adhaerens]|uniref:Uncharacterized protein n=1 Tax=Trichoplax adhaerens TaxID=10228 RepID=B3S7F1_TRIAD|nr:hypothetical protein TRIADDRAFT_60143 [Trichoplax adhaerens]EDV21278.1 hypothetical protein TRIADDRAFT_60143 [Trichoplax adhaerens]|eukprot:XP_002116245.1 hypothetical protein TRIADDRAFT_60143 [Trichoplax adhaerens]